MAKKRKDGTVRYVERKSGTKYIAELMVAGKRQSKTFDDRIDAELWIRDKKQAELKGESLPGETPQGDMLFSDAADKFIVETRLAVSRSQSKSYEYSRRILLRSKPFKGLMSSITPQDVSAHLYQRMSIDGVGTSAIRNELSFLRGVYQKAVEWGINIPSPELNIKRPTHKQKSREDKLTLVAPIDEINAVFESAKLRRNNLHLYLRFLLFTGMRPNEAATLYWEKLPPKKDKAAMGASRPRGFVDEKRGGFSLVGTKTETRFVPAHPEALKIVKVLREQRKKNKLNELDKLVFLDNKYEGRDEAYKYYRRSLQTTLQNARVRTPEEQEKAKKILKEANGPIAGERDALLIGSPLNTNVNFYTFRHTFRSNTAPCGIPTEVGETIIGHNDRSFKFTYIHLDDETLVKEIAKLEYPGLVDL